MSEVCQKHVPERTCVACRKKRPQGEFLRFTKDTQGLWQMDSRRGKPARAGRGTYLCADNPACGQEKKLRRTFGAQAEKMALSVAAFHQLNQELESGTAPTGVTG
ncbi:MULTISPECIES: YlxR family protein [Deinococcus]|uniref:YlxR family protein n=1 Tax=Deinococcus cavernae TaxID=2320857 RepID=A0A418V4H1_9DEIO|nr:MULTISPECIES: YlxR family protein [Deinococcus]RJF71021.1 YlxR family protein [Deinococcus cavernae]